uniref:Glycine-rich protein 2 n=1 Tax=Solanum tuberosum TaxID=4113 RepID=M1BJ68_SOLTU
MTTTSTFTGIVTVLTTCVAASTTALATITGVSTTSTVITFTLGIPISSLLESVIVRTQTFDRGNPVHCPATEACRLECGVYNYVMVILAYVVGLLKLVYSLEKWPDSPETTTFSTNSSATISSSPPYPRLPYTIEAAFTAVEEVEEEKVVFSVGSLATYLGCDPE